MKYEISDEIKNNIFVFLNRIKFEGLNEANSAMEIVKVLNTPIIERESEINGD
jgi:hypothetical protein